MTVSEAARRLNLTPGRIRQLLIAGTLKGRKIAPLVTELTPPLAEMWVVPESEIDRYAALKASGAIRPGPVAQPKAPRERRPVGRPRKTPLL